MEFTPAEIHRLTRLARVDMVATEIEAYRAQLGGIFGLIDALQAVETTGILPLAHPLDVVAPTQQRLRDDTPEASEDRDANMANAPASENGLFLVPKVIE